MELLSCQWAIAEEIKFSFIRTFLYGKLYKNWAECV